MLYKPRDHFFNFKYQIDLKDVIIWRLKSFPALLKVNKPFLTRIVQNKYNEYNLILYQLQVVSRYRDSRLQAGDNYSYFLFSDQIFAYLDFNPFISWLNHCYWELNERNIKICKCLVLTLSSLNLPLSSSSATSRELQPQFSTCSEWRWFHEV